MATVAEGLFGITPESLMAERDRQTQAQALRVAQLDPLQQARFSGFMATNQLGNAVGGLLGAQDPELMRVRQRQELLQGLDIADPMALRQAAQRAMEANDFQAATSLAQRAMSVEESAALTAQRRAAAGRERQQAIPADIQTAQRIAALEAAIPELEASGDTASLARVKAERDQLVRLTTKETARGASELGKLIAERDALDPVKNASEIKAYNDKIKKLTTGKSLGEEIAAGLTPTLSAISKQQSEKAGAAGGTAVGKQSAEVQGKYDALTSLKEALDVVDRGIYAGGYGPMQEAMAKYSGGVIGNKNRLVNTEEFRSLIGNVVIPRLQDFGGNDSVEELKYLRSVLAGETTLEPAAIKRILTAAERKIQAGVKRLETQQQAIVEGKPLPVGALPQQGATPRATRRFNLSTGQFEVIGGQ